MIVLPVFYLNFRFFRDEHIKSAGYKGMPFKLKLLTAWIVFLLIQSIFDFVFRVFIRILTIHGQEALN